MLRRIDLRESTDRGITTALPRAAVDVETAARAVRPIIEAVRVEGVPAVRRYAREYDKVEPRTLRVPAEVLAAARDAVAPDVVAALTESIARARKVHEAQRRTDVTTEVVPGGTVTERWVPVRRVGLYVPGGLAPLASSVVMNVVPAQAAGVTSLALASPPQLDNDGWPAPTILAACTLLGVDEVYAVGGATAIAMFAYGLAAHEATGDAPVAPVDLVTGPGRISTVAAKRVVRGVVGIDAEMGATEIAVLADDSADPAYVAADLISQAEHDPDAASVLVTTSGSLADAVDRELDRQVPAAKHAGRIEQALAGSQSGTVLVRDIAHGLDVVNAYAAEHLEILTADAAAVSARVVNAGCVFVGPFAPVSLGDYCAGSNHVLPTGGVARHSSGLSVQSFLRGIHVVEYDVAALGEVAPHVVTLATAEDLPAHGAAVIARTGSASPGETDQEYRARNEREV
ncbi:MAG: histidinol dehydrogenase [Mycobacteriales bacterium]